MAKLIKFTGTVEEVKPANGTNCFTLEELQGFVGGYIELVPFKPFPLIVNEEGRLLELPINETATEISGIILVGNVLELSEDEWNATMH